jgi:hypothetical protein
MGADCSMVNPKYQSITSGTQGGQYSEIKENLSVIPEEQIQKQKIRFIDELVPLFDLLARFDFEDKQKEKNILNP